MSFPRESVGCGDSDYIYQILSLNGSVLALNILVLFFSLKIVPYLHFYPLIYLHDHLQVLITS